ncbi:hypothetical protein P8452_18192 [Trifolium repens]|nr:hypothetical protein P8452_18192 [Trifolium repens]
MEKVTRQQEKLEFPHIIATNSHTPGSFCDHNQRNLGSWAERTGFVCDYSGEAGSSESESEKFELFQQRGSGSSSSPAIEIDHVSGRRMRQNRDAWCCWACTTTMAELWAIFKGLQLAKDRGFMHIEI